MSWQDLCFLVLPYFNWAMLIDDIENIVGIKENSDFLGKVTAKTVRRKSTKRIVQNTPPAIVWLGNIFSRKKEQPWKKTSLNTG